MIEASSHYNALQSFLVVLSKESWMARRRAQVNVGARGVQSSRKLGATNFPLILHSWEFPFFFLQLFSFIYVDISLFILVLWTFPALFIYASLRLLYSHLLAYVFFVLYLFLYLIDHFNDSTFAKISRIPVFCNLFKIIFCYYCRQLEKIIACSSFLQEDF